MKNKPQEPPEFSVKVANTVFVLGILFSVLIVLYAVHKIRNPSHDNSPAFYYISILCGGISATLFGFGSRRLSDGLKVNLSLVFITAAVSVYACETYLEYSRETQTVLQSRKAIAEQMGIPYDTRTTLEVIEDLRDSGIEAYPNLHAGYMVLKPSTRNGLNTGGNRILPLGGISNSVVVLSNESGYWSTYKGDKFGFHNPNNAYRNSEIDVLMTGDSFAEGWSVKSSENISGVLREMGLNVVSVGKCGNGPLVELAALKEYAEPLRPRVVLWLYYSNDIENLKNEMKSSLLKMYLNDDDFSQNLILRQDEIDSVLVDYVRGEWDRIREWKREGERVPIIENNRVMRILKLYNLRSRINLTPTPATALIPIFKNILEKSMQMVSGWEGRMYFVYLDSYNRYSTGKEHRYRQHVLRAVAESDIPVIDIEREVFACHPDPLSLFPFRMEGHYNAEGYRLVAEAIGKRLRAEGVVPSKPDN